MQGPALTYLGFLRAQRRFLAFGAALTFFASFGQTYFISLSSAHLMDAFGIGHGTFGTTYGLATLSSACIMIQAGRLIDRFDLRFYAPSIAFLMVLACLSMAAMPTGSVVFLFITLLLLRLSGQGLMSHCSVTSMARYFDADRGKALAVGSLGATAGEAVLPYAAVLAMGLIGWRATWGVLAAILGVGLVPLLLWLLRGHALRDLALNEQLAGSRTRPTERQWSRGEVLRDPFFLLLLPTVLGPSFIMTGIFFNQVDLVATKGWSIQLFAGAFLVYALATVASTLVTGRLVDRHGCRRLMPWVLFPLGAALVVLWLGASPLAAILFMAVAGVGGGYFNTVMGAVWPDLYGVTHLGSIRALVTSLSVLASAASPALTGWMLDRGHGIESLILVCLVWVLVAVALAAVGRSIEGGRRRVSG
jgi:MFS family permease